MACRDYPIFGADPGDYRPSRGLSPWEHKLIRSLISFFSMNAAYCSLSVGGSKCCLSHLSFSRLRLWRRHIPCVALVLPMVSLRALDATWEYAVQVSASVQISPPQIALSWPPDLGATPNGYAVYRKAPEANSWSDGITLPGTATGFIDANVTIGATPCPRHASTTPE